MTHISLDDCYNNIDDFPFDECYNKLIDVLEEIKFLESKKTGEYWCWAEQKLGHDIKRKNGEAYSIIGDCCPHRYVSMIGIKKVYKALYELHENISR